MIKISILITLLLHLFCTKTAAVIHGHTTTASPSNKNANNECGITASYYTDNTNRLISNGETILPGQWPWLVALNILINDEFVNKFKCAGSVLTTKHVITAAQCLKLNDLSNNTLDVDNLYVAFGQFDLRQWHLGGTINRQVASYRIHPNYAHTSLSADSDLAILILRTSVEYSPFIRPICLWSGSTTLQNVVNRMGYVVGWGKDENGIQNTEEPRMERVLIANQEECDQKLNLFKRLFDLITSNGTFCAGMKPGMNYVTTGDSGSGLVLFDAITNRYQLRGVLSRWPLDLGSTTDGKYLLYVDIAFHVPWIQQQISETT